MTRRAVQRALYEELVGYLEPHEQRLLYYAWRQKRRPRSLFWPMRSHQIKACHSLHEGGLLESCRENPPRPHHVEYCLWGCYRPNTHGWNVILIVRELLPALRALGL